MIEIEISRDGEALVNGRLVGRAERTPTARQWRFTDLAGRSRLANNRTALERAILQAAEEA